MTSIIYLTDIHLSDKSPISRRDNYFESICSKLEQTDKIAKERNVDYVLMGGDLTHGPYENYRVFNWLNSFLKQTHVKWKSLIGQTHDYVGNWETNKQKTIMYSLSNNNVLELVGDTFRWQVEDIKIFASHQTICPSSFYGHFIAYKDLKEDCSICLLSHLHMPFETEIHNGITFIAPGSISRNSSDNYNLKRIPRIVYLEIDKNQFKYEFIELNVSTDIWNQKHLLSKEEEKNALEIQSMNELETIITEEEDLDSTGIIKKIGEKYSDEVIEEAIKITQRIENES